MPDRVIGPLREARQPLHDGLHQLQVAGGAVTTAEFPIALAALDGAVRYLDGVLLPQCRAEQFTLFPAVDGVIGKRGASLVMEVQHDAIARMTGDLRQVVEAVRTDGDAEGYARYLQPLLYGLYALVRSHLEAEDEGYLSLLDEHLSESQVGVVVENLQRISSNQPSPGESSSGG
ncbi:MAG: hemerythrin domain-containing protein [Hyphomicrobiales bacterium]